MPKPTLIDPSLLIDDDEGGTWTPQQVRDAAAKLAEEEAGNGTLGGLAEGDDGSLLSAAVPEAPAAADEPAPDRSQRELNPANFGDFFRSNIFGGLDAKYVTGKRPMTAFDYATDVLSAYGGEDIGKRNAGLRDRAAKDALAQQQIRTARAKEQKAGLETDKLANEAIVNMMNNLDSDLWAGELKALSKEHGITVRPGVISMVERMAQMLNEAGVSDPSIVLQNPDTYDPNLVNRVRHTMSLLTKSVEESEQRRTETEKGKMALGMREGPEQREQEKYGEQTGGTEDILAILREQTQDPNPKVANLARAQMAIIRRGGPAADRVLEQIGGAGKNAGAGGRGIEFQSLLRKAMIDLGEDPEGQPSSAAIERAYEIRNRQRAAGEMQVSLAKTVAAKKANVAEGLANIDTMIDAVNKAGFGQAGIGGRLKSFGTAVKGKIVDSPALRTIDAVNSSITNIARSLGGQKGVLSDYDTRLIIQGIGFKPERGDTVQGWLARINYFKAMAQNGLAELERAEREGRDPNKITLSAADRQALGVEDQEGGPAPTAGGGDSRRELAQQWAARINAEPDPQKQQELRAKAREELSRQ